MFFDELVTSDNVLPIDTVNLTQRSFFFSLDPLILEVLLRYIVLLFPIPPSTCLLYIFVLEFLSSFP